MEKDELRKEWERRIATFRSSGQTQAKWCEANNLKLRQLKYWLYRIEEPTSKIVTGTSFAPVVIEEPTPRLNDTLLVKKVGDISIDIKPGFNPSLLVEVVRTLKTLC